MTRVIYRFTRDLRLEDHAGLASAAALGEVVPVLVLDRGVLARVGASPRRAAFYCKAVRALDDELRARGTQLIVRRASAPQALRSIARSCGASAVAWAASFDADGVRADQELQSRLEESGLRASVVHDALAIAPEETTAARPSTGDGYRSFNAYYLTWRDLLPASYELPLLLSFAPTELPSEPLPEPAEFGASQASCPDAGSGAARVRFERFLSADALQYSLAINLPADDRTSHLSADLSFGTISARSIVRRTRASIDDPFLLAEERASLKLFLRSVALRDFFLQLAWYNPQTGKEPLQEKMRNFPFAQSHSALEAWRSGCTGYPLVDAGIAQLKRTGWMHPRVRSIAASFLCFDLGVDWRVGMAEWDKQLIEDDPALAVGNWQWIAGVGADLAAYPRIFNPRKQARRFDPGALYVKRWIPELAHLPASAIGLAPSPQAQIELPLFPESSYAKPVVDHDVEARAFLKRYQRFAGVKS